MKNDLDPFNESFINLVKSARGERIKEDVFDGRLVMAKDALSFGLIDGMKTFAETIQYAADQAHSRSANSNNQSMKVLVSGLDNTIDAINAGNEVTPEQIQSSNTELTARGLVMLRTSDAEGMVDKAKYDAAVAAQTDLQNQLDAAKQATSAIKAQFDALKADADAAGAALGLKLAENGSYLDQNNDPVTLKDSVEAVVDQRNAYGKQAGVLEFVEGSAKEEVETEEGYVDPTVEYANQKFGGQ